jgi:2-polyprenyl-3-methyl-5-hydroxy-6-metoxy-1,4-benzoquinol methylase
MSRSQAKWDRIYSQEKKAAPSACAVLQENSHLLPATGRALDLACGLGSNALFLAKFGLKTDAWDLSPVAIEKLQQIVLQGNLPLTATQQDLTTLSPITEQYDVIVVSHYLDRPFCKEIVSMLKPEGLLFYQTFTAEKVSVDGPTNPKFVLSQNELLGLFSELTVLVYREEGLIGDRTQGFRNQAMLVAIKARTSGK